MATKKSTNTVQVEEKAGIEEIDESREVVDVDDVEELDEIEDLDDDDSVSPIADEDVGETEDDLDDGSEEAPAAALDELEAAELSMLTPDEAAEVIRVDEAAEVASLRQAELALDKEADGVATGEFVCSSCFLVKKDTQLANKSKQICRDCAA